MMSSKYTLTQLKVLQLEEISSGQKWRTVHIHTKEYLKANPMLLATVQNDSESTCNVALDK